jgi:hypothetical protein
MKKAIYVVLALVATPAVLFLIGKLLSWVFSCTGFDYISQCSVPAVTGLVSGLVGMFWLLVFAIPLGMCAIAVIVIWSAIFGTDDKD